MQTRWTNHQARRWAQRPEDRAEPLLTLQFVAPGLAARWRRAICRATGGHYWRPCVPLRTPAGRPFALLELCPVCGAGRRRVVSGREAADLVLRSRAVALARKEAPSCN